MKHLRTDWQGIQDIRQWLLNELEGLESLIIDGEYETAESYVTDLVDRVRQMCGIDKEAENLPDGSSILDDEPIFIVRAKDAIAADTVDFWAECAERAGSTFTLSLRAHRFANEMRNYADAKRADGTWGPVHAPDAPELLP